MAFYSFILTLVSSIAYTSINHISAGGPGDRCIPPSNDYLSKITPAPIRIVTITKQCPSILQQCISHGRFSEFEGGKSRRKDQKLFKYSYQPKYFRRRKEDVCLLTIERKKKDLAHAHWLNFHVSQRNLSLRNKSDNKRNHVPKNKQSIENPQTWGPSNKDMSTVYKNRMISTDSLILDCSYHFW